MWLLLEYERTQAELTYEKINFELELYKKWFRSSRGRNIFPMTSIEYLMKKNTFERVLAIFNPRNWFGVLDKFFNYIISIYDILCIFLMRKKISNRGNR
jgi:hypothetical protein